LILISSLLFWGESPLIDGFLIKLGMANFSFVLQKTNKEVSRNVIDFLLISPNVHLVEVFYHWNLIEPDPDDNKFIDCALSSNALVL